MRGRKSKRDFIYLEICIGLLYLFAVYETGIFNGHISGREFRLTVIAALIMMAGIVVCIMTSSGIGRRDALTGIGNADWIMSKVGRLHSHKKLSRYTAIFLNIKESKYMNEKLGNRNGDIIIHNYARKLKALLGKKGFVGRMGGDNFYIYVKNDYFDRFMESLKHVTFTVECNGESISYKVKSRCGYLKVTDDVDYHDILNHTSTALAIAREKGPDAVEFEDSMKKEFMAEKQVLADFGPALANNEFEPYYQPKVDLRTGRLCGAEALVRWVRNGEVISPAAFVPYLEKSEKITELDFCIFEKMCIDIRTWLDMGLEPVCISSNFSKLHLQDENFASKIIEIMDRHSVAGRYIEIELTESSCMEDFRLLKKFAADIRNAGINLAVDDFGTGYSSLSMLNEINADVIKLDKSFLDNASGENERSRTFIRDVINMIDNLGQASLCEGVETKEQLEFLSDAGCDMIQGYYFDRPLPQNEFEKRIREPQYIRD